MLCWTDGRTDGEENELFFTAGRGRQARTDPPTNTALLHGVHFFIIVPALVSSIN